MNGGKGENNNNKKSLVDFVLRYLEYHKNKNQNINNEIDIGKNEKKTNNNIIAPIIQKGDNFSINQNSLFQNLKNNNYDEFYKDNDLSMGSFGRNFNLDLDLKNAKSNSSINPLNNSNSNFNAWPKK